MAITSVFIVNFGLNLDHTMKKDLGTLTIIQNLEKKKKATSFLKNSKKAQKIDTKTLRKTEFLVTF